jgi:hypothetical protein
MDQRLARLDPTIKAQWVAALRSGEYMQGKYALCTVSPDGYVKHCCLGVLTELAVKAGLPIEKGFTSQGTAYNGEVLTLLHDVRAWAWGLGPRSPHDAAIKIQRTVERLAQTNDGVGPNELGKDFEYIADFIEKNL